MNQILFKSMLCVMWGSSLHYMFFNDKGLGKLRDVHPGIFLFLLLGLLVLGGLVLSKVNFK